MAAKGQPKSGGRQKGTPNKQTQDLMSKCEEAGIDPFMGLLLIARDGDEETTRFNALKEVCQYLYPKRKAIEHTHDVDPELLREAEQLARMAPEDLKSELSKELKLVKSKS